MFYSKTFKKLKDVNKFLINLTDQPPEKGVIRGKKFKNSFNLKQGKNIVPAITVCEDTTTYIKGDIVSLSCYYTSNLFSFQTEISRIIKNRIVIKKPDEITLVKQRASARYTPTPSDNIQFIIPYINKTFKPLNIGIRGICIISEENLKNNGLIFSQCILKTDKKEFFVDCNFRNWMNDINGYWKFGIELLFSDSHSFFQYLEWIYSLLQKEIYPPPWMSLENLKTCFENSRSTLIAKDSVNMKDIYNKIESWVKQDLIGPLNCDFALVKNGKFVSACSTKRIYNNTFFVQWILSIPGQNLDETPELKLYASLSELLFHHPSCSYLIMYMKHDIEWYERFFNEVVNYTKDPSDVHITRLCFIDISINIEDSKTADTIKKSFFIAPLLDKDDFFDFANHDLPSIINNSYNYSSSQNDTGLISDLLNAAGHSMVRKIYKVTNNDTIIAFAVCEVYSDEYITNNSLDLCRIYYCVDIKNHSMLLNEIINEVSLFYASYRKKRFRIIWGNRKINVNRITVCNSLDKGTLLRLIVSKQGLISLQQATLFSEEKLIRYYYRYYPGKSIQYNDDLVPDSAIEKPPHYIDSVCGTQNKTSNKKKSYVQISNKPLLQHFYNGELDGVTSAAVSYIPEFTPGLSNKNQDRIRSEWLDNNPMWCSVMGTHWGRIAIILIPVFSNELYNNLNLINETVRALALAGKIGARTVSLTGLIPSATNYGRTVAEAVAHRNDLPIISTGQATTCASVVLAIDKILKSGDRFDNPGKIAFLGLGSIGKSTLSLMMKSLPHPEELILYDLFMKNEKIDRIKQQLISEMRFYGKISIVSSERKSRLPQEIYSADLIIGTNSVPNILDIEKIKPGTMIVDYSVPHCFNPVNAIRRLEEKRDILFTEGGYLQSPQPIKQLIYQPSILGLTKPILEQHPFNITGCVFSSLLLAKYKDLKPTLGLVDVESSMQQLLKLKELGFKGADLHCWDFRKNSPFLIPSEVIHRFKQRFGRQASQETK